MAKFELEPGKGLHATPFKDLPVGDVFLAGTSNILYIKIHPVLSQRKNLGGNHPTLNVVSLLHGNVHIIDDDTLVTPIVAQIQILEEW